MAAIHQCSDQRAESLLVVCLVRTTGGQLLHRPGRKSEIMHVGTRVDPARRDWSSLLHPYKSDELPLSG